ncbi:hypothetical protein [Streptomyces sp. 150FB]|uniref:hypothetical protein n=1 Tax=Streptomyces sp. 150FB TaxID=1576605 RepID=UPI001F2F38EA|nr:hypothetical protein [Streptomyces sp. 150FB]
MTSEIPEPPEPTETPEAESYRYGLARAAADWPTLKDRLDPAALSALAGHLTEFRNAGPGTPRRTAAAAAALRLLDRSSEEAGARFAGETFAPAGFTPDDLAVLVLDGHRMVGPVLGAVRERLLAAPALDEPDGTAGGGPDGSAFDVRLIRLPGAGGRGRCPAFQFREAPEAWPVVLVVNEMLDSGRDPWGAADWWLSANTWLRKSSPASLLGSGQDAQLAEAAAYLTENP